MTNQGATMADVERLARVREMVAEALYRQVHPDCGPMTGNQRGHAFQKADKLLLALRQSGLTVTLPTPPRVTPLEAAARVIGHEFALLDDEAINCARKTLTAAVGALSEEALWAIRTALVHDEKDARAALLARLTEGGAR